MVEYCTGVTPIPTQQRASNSLFHPGLLASTLNTLWRGHCMELMNTTSLLIKIYSGNLNIKGMSHRMQVPHKMQVFRKRRTAILGDIQKTSDIHTNIFISEEKKIKDNNHGYFYMDMKKLH